MQMHMWSRMDTCATVLLLVLSLLLDSFNAAYMQTAARVMRTWFTYKIVYLHVSAGLILSSTMMCITLHVHLQAHVHTTRLSRLHM